MTDSRSTRRCFEIKPCDIRKTSTTCSGWAAAARGAFTGREDVCEPCQMAHGGIAPLRTINGVTNWCEALRSGKWLSEEKGVKGVFGSMPSGCVSVCTLWTGREEERGRGWERKRERERPLFWEDSAKRDLPLSSFTRWPHSRAERSSQLKGSETGAGETSVDPVQDLSGGGRRKEEEGEKKPGLEKSLWKETDFVYSWTISASSCFHPDLSEEILTHTRGRRDTFLKVKSKHSGCLIKHGFYHQSPLLSRWAFLQKKRFCMTSRGSCDKIMQCYWFF